MWAEPQLPRYRVRENVFFISPRYEISAISILEISAVFFGENEEIQKFASCSSRFFFLSISSSNEIPHKCAKISYVLCAQIA